ncbi:DedA family protein [Oscillospiraceae bacterium PP1C4]
MQNWIVEIMNQFGYIGILFLIAVENIFPPIPSEVILTFGGFMTTYSNMNVWGVIAVATVGSVLGAIILYGVGRLLSPERLECWLNGKIGRMLHFKAGDVTKACLWFEKRGKSTVFFCRCIPIVRSLISIPAGMARMGMWLFLLLTTAGSLVWNIILVYLGVVAGASWELIVGYMDTYSIITLGVLCAAALVVAAVFFKKRFLQHRKSSNEDD